MAGGANPQQTQTPQQNGVFGQSAGAYNAALGGTQAAAAGPNIGAFMNPYTEQVTGNTLDSLERQRQMATNNMGAQATQAGAFGGSRHGVADAMTNEGFARQGADTFGQLQQQGFNTALGGAQNQQQVGLDAARQMGSLSNMGFGFGQQIGQQQAQQGGQQQALMQQLMNAGRQQYAGFAGAPQAALNLPLQALGGAQFGQSTTETKQPGLFDYLTLGASAVASDPRLKENVQHVGDIDGVRFYNWDWNEEGLKVASPGQGTFGVMADELQKTHPELVTTGADGYLRVNYSGLKGEIIGGLY
ncbi:tail spike protein/chaperone [Octadecabacter Antarctic DB virus 2]|nr:tail spike protein/chaperone [Octadecabacter Antarctic DB virus 2]